MSEGLTLNNQSKGQEELSGDQVIAEVKALPYIKEVRLPDRQKLEALKRRIDQLAQNHTGDAFFQKNVVGYLREGVKFLELPTIIDTFGDRPEDHNNRRNEVRTLGRNNPVYKYLETQKLSGGNVLGGVLMIFPQIQTLYRPAAKQEDLARVVEDATHLRTEVVDKFDGTVTTPLAEKLEIIKRIEHFVESAIDTCIEAYTGAKNGARAYRNIRNMRAGDEIIFSDRKARVKEIGEEDGTDRYWISLDDGSTEWFSDKYEQVEVPFE